MKTVADRRKLAVLTITRTADELLRDSIIDDLERS